jgi:hypothetical protein
MFAFFANEPDFVSELVALMYTQMSAAVPETVQVCVKYAVRHFSAEFRSGTSKGLWDGAEN